jgi:hypothetical protein
MASNSQQERAPDLDAIDWPEPRDCREDNDPMFDSTRSYVEQVDRYKRHQGKPTTRRTPIRKSFGRPKPKARRPRWKDSTVLPRSNGDGMRS